MKPLPHTYEVKMSGGAEGYATVSSAGVPDLRMAPPLDFDGPGDAWSPEQLLVAAVESCFLFTLRAVAAASKIKFTAFELSGEGKLEHKEGTSRFTEIVLKTRVTIPAGTDKAAAERALEKAKNTCFVASSLTSAVRLEPQVSVSN